MYKILLFLFLISSLSAVTSVQVDELNLGAKYTSLVFTALNKSGSNEAELVKALKSCPAEHKTAISFLISFMPERDLRDLKAAFLLENTKLAFAARKKFPWGEKVPMSVFLNDVLPYATLNERRDNWRQDFYERFSKIVKDCQTIEEATVAINKSIKKNVGVIYSTKRPKADQSPYESMKCKLASCTGLSVLLTDALRSVGIPSRIVGTPAWTGKRGNHNWNEVWINGDWQFTEYYFAGLNKGWFLKDAAMANEKNWQNKIYASSFSPTQYWFPLVWDFNIRYVHGIDVTRNYKAIYAKVQEVKKRGQKVFFSLFEKKGGSRFSRKVTIFNDKKKLVAEGECAGQEDDLNKILELTLIPGKYIAYFPNKIGEAVSREFLVKKDQKNRINLYLEN